MILNEIDVVVEKLEKIIEQLTRSAELTTKPNPFPRSGGIYNLKSEGNTIQPSVSTPFLFLRERDGDRVEDEMQ